MRALRVAIADDEAEIRDYFSKLLVHHGHQVVIRAASGSQLLEQLAAQDVDLVITDLRMPETSSDSLLRTIWSSRSIPVLLVSAYACPSWLEREGADQLYCYLSKPVRRSDLLAAIESLFATPVG